MLLRHCCWCGVGLRPDYKMQRACLLSAYAMNVTPYNTFTSSITLGVVVEASPLPHGSHVLRRNAISKRGICERPSDFESQRHCVRYSPSFTDNHVHSCASATTMELLQKIKWNTCHQTASLAFRFYKRQFRPGFCSPALRRGSLRVKMLPETP